jgi:hypothetical protein
METRLLRGVWTLDSGPSHICIDSEITTFRIQYPMRFLPSVVVEEEEEEGGGGGMVVRWRG